MVAVSEDCAKSVWICDSSCPKGCYRSSAKEVRAQDGDLGVRAFRVCELSGPGGLKCELTFQVLLMKNLVTCLAFVLGGVGVEKDH